MIAKDNTGHVSPPSDPENIFVPDYTPPSTPTGVSTSITGPSVTVAWTASTDDVGVQSYDVYRGDTATFTPTGSPVATTVTTSTTVTAAAGTQYYKVIARDAVGNSSAPSAPAQAVVVDSVAPTTPSGLTGSQVGQDVDLAWHESTDAFGVTGYQVHRSDTAGFTPSASTLVATVNDLSYTDVNAPVGSRFYKIVAVDPSVNGSTPSNEVAVNVTDITPPTTPGAFTATASGESVVLGWTASTDNVAVTKYSVYRGTAPGFIPSPSTLLHEGTAVGYTDPAGPGSWYYRSSPPTRPG